MNNQELFKRFQIKPKSIRKFGSIYMVSTDDRKYVLKKKKRKTNSFDYLISRNFQSFPRIYTKADDDIELMDFLEDRETPLEQRLEDLVYLASILHTKTTFYKTVDMDYIKEIYENTITKQESIYQYYYDLQDMIELEVYMSPSNYLLIRNISIIYLALRRSREFLESWYQKIQTTSKMRYTYIHGNLKPEHLIENEDLYLISWDESRIDLPIYDLLTLYQNSFMDIDLKDILEIYESKYSLKKEEYDLLLALLLIPNKIDLQLKEYPKTKQVNQMILYIDKTLSYLEKNTKETNYDANH